MMRLIGASAALVTSEVGGVADGDAKGKGLWYGTYYSNCFVLARNARKAALYILLLFSYLNG